MYNYEWEYYTINKCSNVLYNGCPTLRCDCNNADFRRVKYIYTLITESPFLLSWHFNRWLRRQNISNFYTLSFSNVDVYFGSASGDYNGIRNFMYMSTRRFEVTTTDTEKIIVLGYWHIIYIQQFYGKRFR